MKRIILIVLIALTAFAYAGDYRQYDTKEVFYKRYTDATITVPKDSVSRLSGATYFTINTITGVADSAQSMGFYKDDVECTQTIYAGVDSLAGTTSVVVYYGVYRGPELGWLWSAVDTLSSDGDYGEININDTDVLSWARNRIVDVWGIKLKEIGAQKNRLWLRVIEKEMN